MPVIGVTHRRDYEHPTKAICGAGYDWPSSVPLTDDPIEVTCPRCISKEPTDADD